ncbi:MAG: hypothetical protein ACYC69_17345 [Thermodesulfovibrionales bacterium]
MGLFDFLKQKPKLSKEADAAIAEIAKKMFPNGYADVERGGRDIAKIISGKLSEEKCRHLFAVVKSLTIISEDKSKERIIESLIMRGEGKITENEVALIYRYLIDADPVILSAQDKT